MWKLPPGSIPLFAPLSSLQGRENVICSCIHSFTFINTSRAYCMPETALGVRDQQWVKQIPDLMIPLFQWGARHRCNEQRNTPCSSVKNAMWRDDMGQGGMTEVMETYLFSMIIIWSLAPDTCAHTCMCNTHTHIHRMRRADPFCYEAMLWMRSLSEEEKGSEETGSGLGSKIWEMLGMRQPKKSWGRAGEGAGRWCWMWTERRWRLPQGSSVRKGRGMPLAIPVVLPSSTDHMRSGVELATCDLMSVVAHKSFRFWSI